jgi:hypothetical protein
MPLVPWELVDDVLRSGEQSASARVVESSRDGLLPDELGAGLVSIEPQVLGGVNQDIVGLEKLLKFLVHRICSSEAFFISTAPAVNNERGGA